MFTSSSKFFALVLVVIVVVGIQMVGESVGFDLIASVMGALR